MKNNSSIVGFRILFIVLFLSTLVQAQVGNPRQSALDSLRLVLPLGHNSTIENIVFDPTTKFMLSTSRDNISILHSVYSGKEILRHKNEDLKSLVSSCFSNDSRLLAFGSQSGVELIDLHFGKSDVLIGTNNQLVEYVNFFKNGKCILYITEDSIVNVLKLNRNKKRNLKLDDEFKKIELNSIRDKVLISYGGNFIKNNKLSIIDLPSLKKEMIEIPDGLDLEDFKFVNDRFILISVYNSISDKSSIYLYDIKKRENKYFLDFDSHAFNLEVNVNSGFFLTALSNHSIRLFNLYNGDLIKELNDHNYFITDVKFNEKGDRLASCAMDSTFIVYKIDSTGINIELKTVDKINKLNALSFKGDLLAVGGFNNSVLVYDFKKNKINFSLEGLATNPTSVQYKSDGKTLLSSWDASILKEINIKNGQIINSYLSTEITSHPNYNNNETQFSVTNIDGKIKIYTLGVNKPVTFSCKENLNLNSSSFSNNNLFLATTAGSIDRSNSDKSINVINTTNGEIADYFRTKGINRSANFSCDDRYLIVSTGVKAVLYDLQNKTINHSFIHGKSGVTFSDYGDQCKVIVITCEDGTIYLYDNQSLSLIDSIKIEGLSSMTAKLDNQKKTLIVHDSHNIKVFDLTANSNLREKVSYNYSFKINDVELFENILIVCSSDFFTKMINLEYNNLIYERIQLENNNYLVKLPNSPYYMCSKDASKMLHYVTPSLTIIGFEQLDPVYNRPDIVLDSIGKYFGGADQELVANYRQSWEKRIDRLGLDKEKLGKGEIAVPNAEIVGADAIAYENKNGILDIKVAANDPKYPLRRFNVYVNEVPLFGSAGISIAHLKKQVWDTTVSVPLSIGENKIQVSVMNELGLENFKYPSYVNYTPSEPIVAKTYYIGIGVNEFKESSHNLKYCVKDVTDLSTSFGEPNTEIKLFTNSQVTKENILALKDYLSKTTVNDKVIISCSSHGLLDDSLNFYLAMHDVDFNNPKERGLKYEALENLLDGIPARQKLLLLDACNSGENDKMEVFKNELANNHNNMDSTQILAARGVIIKLKDENKSNFKKMNELFVNVRNNTGSVIISAAGGQESALEAITVEGKSIENGAFSYCVLEYLQNNSNNPEELTVNKLKNYVEKRVEEITNGKQQPTSRQETMEIDWRLR